MDKIRLGKTEMMVSKLGFGGIPIQRVSEDTAVAIVKKCLELGINFLDTANGYTTSEERIGKAIAGQRERLILATKSHARTREELESHIKLSLKRLGVEYIDLYQFHQVGDSKSLEIVLGPNGPMAVVEEAKKAGVVKHIGATSHQIDVAKDLVKSDRFETIMFPFNFITSEPADELLPLCREHDVGFIAMKPLGGGDAG
ncbi:aldo/keto reductase [Chloroflexota bacterium]